MSTEETKQDALNQADLQMASIHTFITALNLDWDRLEELREERDNYDAGLTEDDEELDAPALWAADNPDDAEELKDLEEYAGDWDSREDVERAIQEDPLSVEVRSGWVTPGAELESEDFRIVLCTGGPHVEIIGELDRYRQPCRAWLQYNGWFIPMTERVNEPGDQETLLAYASQFYFGE